MGDRALADWCAMWLSARPVETVFTVEHLSRAVGVVLDDGRRVVVKIRPASARLQACAYVQRHLWRAGFPCPEPLVGPVPYDGSLVAGAEMIVDDGVVLDDTVPGAAPAYAGLLARLIRLAPAADDVRLPGEPLPWTGWDHSGTEVWPPPDDRPDDLNAYPETAWLDDLGRSVRSRLAEATDGMPRVVAHGDWEAQNLRWRGLDPVAVHDWDSVVVAPEPVVVGLAAAVWPSGAGEEWHDASVGQSAAFLDAYQQAVGRVFTERETRAAWAGGLWVLAFNAKKASLDGIETLTRAEAARRAAYAGI